MLATWFAPALSNEHSSVYTLGVRSVVKVPQTGPELELQTSAVQPPELY